MIVRCDWRAVTRQLDVAVGGTRHRTQARKAIEICLIDDEGRAGRGECAPLPGYSLDSVDAAAAALATYDVPRDQPLESLLTAGFDSELPALRCAFECALLDLAAQRERQPLWQLLRGSEALELTLSAVLLGDDASLPSEAVVLREEGYRVVKRKLGATLTPLKAIARPLRLDGNRSWTLAQLREHARELDALEPELVEEPCAAPLAEAARIIDAPLAADESLAAATTAEALAKLETIDAPFVVVKPARDGLVGALRLGRRARELGKRVIVTHMWDGPIGHLAAAHVALALGTSDSPAQGLAPQPGLDEASFPQLLVRGRLVPPRGAGLSDA